MQARLPRRLLASLALVLLSFCFLPAGFLGATPHAQDNFSVGDTLRLVERFGSTGNPLGTPGHPTMGSSAISRRLPNNAEVTVTTLGTGAHSHWLEVEFQGVKDWIISKYVAEILPSGPVVVVPVPLTSVVVGCWNLEHFHHGTTRGFPENTRGGLSFPSRTSAQIQAIANVIIQDLQASFLSLCEINGENVTDPQTGEITPTLPELNDLLGFLPATWDYSMGFSGGAQRIAFLYDTAVIEVHEVIEWDVPFRRVDNKDIFARDPLGAHISFLQGGQQMNDLVIIGLHLASGQRNDDNHDAAMQTVQALLAQSLAQGELGGAAEQDVLFMGDLNANMFRPPAEQFFLDMDVIDRDGDGALDPNPWDVLAGDGYPATRLSGNPLKLGTSEIDYIIASTAQAGRTGLVDEEITADTATVRTDLLTLRTPTQFRSDLSDHPPVTVVVQVGPDND